VPAVERIAERRWMRVAFAACAAWAVAVQLGGAFAYTQFGWNVRQGRDVDRPEHRGRLWSVGDGQLAFIATHLGEQRRARLADGQRLVDLYQRLLAPLAR
jgi:hypothetical protein